MEWFRRRKKYKKKWIFKFEEIVLYDILLFFPILQHCRQKKYTVRYIITIVGRVCNYLNSMIGIFRRLSKLKNY